MLRDIIIRMLLLLRLKKPPTEGGIESTLDLSPILYLAIVIAVAVRCLGTGAPLPWYRRWRIRLKYHYRYLRAHLSVTNN